MTEAWMSYRSEDRLILVDTRFESRHPAELDHLYRLQVEMVTAGPLGHGDEEEASRFQPFDDEMHAATAPLGLVPVGRRRGFGVWDLAWYGPAGAEKKLIKVLKAHPEARFTATEDPDWTHYRDKLLPRGKELHRARNGHAVWQLEQAGDNPDIPRLIEFFVRFHREADRDRYLRDIESTGLDAEAGDDGQPTVRAFFTAPIDLELITDITWELHERAINGNGELASWRCDPVVT